MTHVVVLLLALLIGVVAGLRSLLAPAVLSWAAALGWIVLDGTWVRWLAHPAAVAVLTVLAVVELVFDQLPGTPDRTTPVPFLGRLVCGGFAGAVVGTAWGYPFGGLGTGLIGAVLGTLGGAAFRAGLTARAGRPALVALAEDLLAVAGGVMVAALVSAV